MGTRHLATYPSEQPQENAGYGCANIVLAIGRYVQTNSIYLRCGNGLRLWRLCRGKNGTLLSSEISPAEVSKMKDMQSGCSESGKSSLMSPTSIGIAIVEALTRVRRCTDTNGTPELPAGVAIHCPYPVSESTRNVFLGHKFDLCAIHCRKEIRVIPAKEVRPLSGDNTTVGVSIVWSPRR